MAHLPVMVEEVVHYLDCQPGKVIVDATIGSAGHGAAILDRIGEKGRLVGIDRDGEALERARQRLAGRPILLVQDNFANLEVALAEIGISQVDGVLFDLGVSSEQLETARRGFSFQLAGPLDMRMDQSSGRTAADLVNKLTEGQLAELLWQYGEERWARRIARAIAQSRQESPVTTTDRLAAIVTAAIPARARRGRIHAATRTFQALRIAVNEEGAALRAGLLAAVRCTRSHGRIAVLSYQSLDDGETKDIFRRLASGREPGPASTQQAPPQVRILTRKPVRPSPDEVARNPRARSGRLRAVEKL
jgi:16S rRNA (cytosine1402-N4)-methyltransferase